MKHLVEHPKPSLFWLDELEKKYPREAQAIKMKFGIEVDPITRAEIGEIMRITPARVDQLTYKGISRIRNKMIKVLSEAGIRIHFAWRDHE